MRVAVFGSGGIGGYFGGRLAEAGGDVTFIARGRHLEALHSTGLRVDSPKGDFVLPQVQATDEPSQVGAVDCVIVGVKSWQVPEAGQSMAPLIGEDTAVLPLQNGVEAADQLVEELGAKHVLGGVARIIARIEAPGHIVHGGVEPYIALGELDGHESDRVRSMVAAFEDAGVWVENPPDINVSIWEKFLIIAPVSGMGAVTRVPIGVFRQLSETRRMLERAIREVESLARARGVALPPDAAARTIGIIDQLPPDGTTSMQRDIMEARPSELEATNGAVVRLAREAGIEAPIHSFIYHSLLPMELAARSKQQ